MLEVRFHGRGGQGAVTAAQILAIATFHKGNQSQAFPRFGTERRGAPVEAFTRISKNKIFLRSAVYNPDIVVVLEPSLIYSVDVTAGLKKEGIIIINSSKKQKIKNFKTYNVDATGIAMKIFGKDIVNTPMLGALAAISNRVDIKCITKAIEERFQSRGKEMIQKNKKAVLEVYKNLK